MFVYLCLPALDGLLFNVQFETTFVLHLTKAENTIEIERERKEEEINSTQT